MVLARPYDTPTPPTPLTVQGFLGLFQPDQLAAPRVQGDGQVQITNDEIAAASWPDPDTGTHVTIDGAVWSVLGATPRFDGAARIGWTLWVRGGQP